MACAPRRKPGARGGCRGSAGGLPPTALSPPNQPRMAAAAPPPPPPLLLFEPGLPPPLLPLPPPPSPPMSQACVSALMRSRPYSTWAGSTPPWTNSVLPTWGARGGGGGAAGGPAGGGSWRPATLLALDPKTVQPSTPCRPHLQHGGVLREESLRDRAARPQGGAPQGVELRRLRASGRRRRPARRGDHDRRGRRRRAAVVAKDAAAAALAPQAVGQELRAGQEGAQGGGRCERARGGGPGDPSRKRERRWRCTAGGAPAAAPAPATRPRSSSPGRRPPSRTCGGGQGGARGRRTMGARRRARHARSVGEGVAATPGRQARGAPTAWGGAARELTGSCLPHSWFLRRAGGAGSVGGVSHRAAQTTAPLRSGRPSRDRPSTPPGRPQPRTPPLAPWHAPWLPLSTCSEPPAAAACSCSRSRKYRMRSSWSPRSSTSPTCRGARPPRGAGRACGRGVAGCGCMGAGRMATWLNGDTPPPPPASRHRGHDARPAGRAPARTPRCRRPSCRRRR
jgi:hypothetical protein